MLREFAERTTPTAPSLFDRRKFLQQATAGITAFTISGIARATDAQEPPRNQLNNPAEKSREEKSVAWTNQTEIQIKELGNDLPGNRENAEKELLRILQIMERDGYALPDTVLSPKKARMNGKITYDVQLRLERIFEQLHNPLIVTQSTEDEPCCGIDPFLGKIQRRIDWLAQKIVELENMLALK